MSPRVLAAALAACGAVWALAVAAFAWVGLIAVLALSISVAAYALMPRPEQPPQEPLRDPATALAEARMADGLCQSMNHLAECEAIWAATERKENQS